MKHINLRLPDDLHAAVKAAAGRDRRSLNTMLIMLIENGLAKAPSGFTPALKDGAPAGAPAGPN